MFLILSFLIFVFVASERDNTEMVKEKNHKKFLDEYERQHHQFHSKERHDLFKENLRVELPSNEHLLATSMVAELDELKRPRNLRFQ